MPISYMQRRKSGIYEFRKRLPEALAGKLAPEHVGTACPDLVNAKTGRFKTELVRSLGTNNPALARKADLKVAHATLEMFDLAQRLVSEGQPKRQTFRPPILDLGELEADARAFWLRRDQEDRESEDPRRVHQTLADRNAIGTDLIPVHEGLPWGMMDDAFQIYGDTLAEDVERYRRAFAKRDHRSSRQAFERHFAIGTFQSIPSPSTIAMQDWRSLKAPRRLTS